MPPASGAARSAGLGSLHERVVPASDRWFRPHRDGEGAEVGSLRWQRSDSVSNR